MRLHDRKRRVAAALSEDAARAARQEEMSAALRPPLERPT